MASADFLTDSKAQLQLKNFYFSRDFRDGYPSQSRRAEWAQGFQLNLKSGYTQGPVGFGVDAVGMLGVKLDSSPARAGTGILTRGEHGAGDNYSKLLVTAKAKFNETELRVGGLSPVLPLLLSNNTRLFDQYFNGAQITSKDLDNFTFHFGRVDRTKLRDSSSFDALTTVDQSGAYSATATSDGYTYGGVDYKVTPNLQLSAHASELQDFYSRQFLGLTYSMPVGPGKAFTDLRFFRAKQIGQEKLGEVDNRVVSTNFGYQVAGHTFSGGYQKISGATAYAYVGGTGTYLFSEQTTSTFSAQNERVWHARYDYDFAALGIPGLKFNVRYVKGDEVDPEHLANRKGRMLQATGGEGREWERTTDISYVIQSGPLKNFGMRWRNGTNRSNYADGADENRVILTYGIDF
nr:OprD family porin [Pseudomonas sp. GL-B-16]